MSDLYCGPSDEDGLSNSGHPPLVGDVPAPNAHAEGFVRSIKEERLNRLVPLGERHLRRAIAEYVLHLPGRTAPSWPPKPATTPEVSTDSSSASWPPAPTRAPHASACAPYREQIVAALALGRNAMAIWQDLVSDRGFPARYASVRRFVGPLRGPAAVDAHVVITTAPGEDYGESPVMVSVPGIDDDPSTFPSVSRTGLRIMSYRDSSQTRRSLGRRAAFSAGRAGDPTKVRASRFIVKSIWMYTSVDFTSTWPRKSLIVIRGTPAWSKCMALVCRRV